MFISSEGILFPHLIQERLVLNYRHESVLLSFSILIFHHSLLFWPCSAFLGHAFCRAAVQVNFLYVCESQGEKYHLSVKALKFKCFSLTFLLVVDLIQQIISPVPVLLNYTWDKVQTTPAENCCMGGSPASVLLHDLGQNCMTTSVQFCTEKSGKRLL